MIARDGLPETLYYTHPRHARDQNRRPAARYALLIVSAVAVSSQRCPLAWTLPMPAADQAADEGPLEIALVGELTQHENDICDKLLGVPPGGSCVLYFNSPGGSAYVALSLATLIAIRGLDATGVVLGECSSAAIWPLAACRRRIVTAHSVLLFHPLKWESGEHVDISEAAEWARHFAYLEQDMDRVLARLLGMAPEKLAAWMRPGRYVTGHEMAEAGLAELVEIGPLSDLGSPPRAAKGKKPKR